MKKLIIGFILVLAIAGCLEQRIVDTSNMTDEAKAKVLITTSAAKEKLKVAYETNWLATAFIIAGVLGIVAVIRGTKGGILIVIGSAIGWLWVRADQALIENNWILLIPVSLAIAATGLFIWRDVIGKKAFKEVVVAVQKVRKTTPDDMINGVDEILDEHESKTTKKLVKEYKT